MSGAGDTVLASLGQGTDHAFTAEHGATLSDLSARSMAAYRKLVYETDGFVDYYRAATPIAEIAEATEYSAVGGGFRNALSRLRSLNLASGRGELHINADLLGAP